MLDNNPVWSEYKISFDFDNKNILLKYLFDKGVIPEVYNIKNFNYNQFNNYKSLDIETSYIGICKKSKEPDSNSQEINYMSEIQYNNINNKLIEFGITTDMLDIAMTTQKSYFMIKRGIIVTKIQPHYKSEKYSKNFNLLITSLYKDKEHKELLNFKELPICNEEHKICRLDLIKILEDENIGWVDISSVTTQSSLHNEKEEVCSESDFVMIKVPKKEFLKWHYNNISKKHI